MASLVEEARKQGYKVESVGGGFYKITNPSTGKSTQAWEGVQYTGSSQLSHLGSPSSSGTSSKSSSGTSSSSRSSSTKSSSSSGTSSGTQSAGSAPSTNVHYQYLEQTWPGGAQQYIQSQQQRYLEAAKSGDTDLMQRLEADAARVGYTLPSIQQQPFIQVQPTINPEVEQLRNELAMLRWQLGMTQSQNSALNDLIRQLQSVQPPQLPTQAPKVETVPENVPVEGVTEQRQDTSTSTTPEAPRGSSGFLLQAGSLPSTPVVSADALYDYYRRLTGREDEGVRQFLASPQFQSALMGTVPAWMAADPIWRAILARAGVNPQQLRLDAIRQRLSGEA